MAALRTRLCACACRAAAWAALLVAASGAAAAPPPRCLDLPTLPTAPPSQGVLTVTGFGAKANDEGDDTAAIQRAIDALKPGQWLVFPPGRYLQEGALYVKQRGVTLWGAGATLHATRSASMAVVLAEDDVSLLNFTLTADVKERGSAPQQSRVSVWRPDRPEQGVRGATVRGNRIIPAGSPAPDTALPCEPPVAASGARPPPGPQRCLGQPGAPLFSGAAGGIFLYHASDFLVAGNRIERTAADGIHVTGGSHHGRVLGNTLRETGDDMVGLVSYLGDGSFTRNTAAELAASLARRTEAKLVHDVLVADNDLSGAYWARGIAVVGGRNITILRNRIADSTRAAAIYVAREGNYVTFGVHNVRVQDNRIDRVQTTRPSYSGGRPLPAPSGHAAIQLHADLFEDERDQPALAEWLDIEDIAVLGNRVNDTASDGLRVNDTHRWNSLGGPVMRDKRADGTVVERRLVPATVRGVWVQSNQFQAVRGSALAWPDSGEEASAVHCADNRLEGRAVDAPLRCAAPAAKQRMATGAALPGCVMP